MKRNKIILLIFVILCIVIKNDVVKADETCTIEVAQQLAKITYHENGFGNFVGDEDEYFFVELVTAGVVFNNASTKSGNSWYEKFYNLTDGNYAGYSKYKNKSFSDDVPLNRQGELLYIAELVLTGKFNLPKNLRGQSSCACLLGTNACQGVNTELRAYDCQGAVGWGKEWTHVNSARSNLFDAYFGYSRNETLATIDNFGNQLSNTSPSYYKALAKKLKTNDYSKYNSNTVCNGLSNSIDIEIDDEDIDDNNSNNNASNDKKEEIIIVEACKNPDILRVIYFVDIIIGIIKIVVPIGLIIMGTIDFSRSIGTNDEEIQKKVIKTFVKRILCGVIIFATPWIIEVLISFLGNITKDINVKECLDNANKESIEKLEAEIENQINNLQNSNNNNSNNNSNNSNSSNNSNNNGNNYIIYIGDSRTVGMCNSVSLSSNENCTISKVGSGYSWLNSSEVSNNLSNILNSHPKSYIVINMGTNSGLTANVAKNYATFYNNLAQKYPNSKVVAVSVTQIDYQKAKNAGMYANITLDDNSVNNFNNNLKSNLNSSIMYCDVYSKMENYNYVANDGVHYNSDTYKFIYNEIQNCLK